MNMEVSPVWRSEEEMLEVVRQRAARRRQRRVLGATAAGCVVAALALAAAVLTGGGRPSQVRVAGSVEGGGPRPGPSPSALSGTGPEMATTTTTHAEEGPTTTTDAARSPSSRDDNSQAPTTVPTTTVPSGDASTPSSSDAASPSPGTPVNTSVPPGSVPPGGGSGANSPRRVTVSPSAVDLRPRPFDSAEPVGPTSVAVRFWGGLPECEPIGRVDVAETSATVTITLYAGRPPGEPMACIAIAIYQELLVELSAPLAGRTIVDGAA